MRNSWRPRSAAARTNCAHVRSVARYALLVSFASTVPFLKAQSSAQLLPDSPGAVLGYALVVIPAPGGEAADMGGSKPQTGKPAAVGWHNADPTPQTPANISAQPTAIPRCSDVQQKLPLHSQGTGIHSSARYPADTPCFGENPLQPIVSTHLPPLTPGQKAFLAVRDVEDPFNLITIFGYSGIVVATNSHTAYGPGFGGFGRLSGYSLLEDAQGEFFGTFVIPALARQDPRYYRMPGRPIPQRIAHAVLHTFVSRHDDGSAMPNYATLLTYPISAELSNLYVPGNAVNGPSTVKRIGLGIATDPVGAVVAEFLPDIAKRIHIHIIFVQQILQQVAAGSPNMGG